MTKSVVFAGGIFCDLLACAERFPANGETIAGSEFRLEFGGKVANQAVMCSRLNSGSHRGSPENNRFSGSPGERISGRTRVRMLGRVGKDQHGDACIENFKANGVDTEFVRRGRGVTGTAMIFVETKGGDTKTITNQGVNSEVGVDDIEAASEAISTSTVLVCGLGMSLEANEAALKIARSEGVITILNAAPIRKNFKPNVLDLVDVLIVNEDEAEAITGIKMTDTSAVESALNSLIKRSKTAIITLGARGAAFTNNGSIEFVPAAPVKKVVDTTGAGDAFVGAVAHFMAVEEDTNMTEIVRKACHVASRVVTQIGAQRSFPFAKDLTDE